MLDSAADFHHFQFFLFIYPCLMHVTGACSSSKDNHSEKINNPERLHAERVKSCL